MLAVVDGKVDALANHVEKILSRKVDEAGTQKNVVMDIIEADRQTGQTDIGGVRLKLRPARTGEEWSDSALRHCSGTTTRQAFTVSELKSRLQWNEA
jgi:hypothetical protein